MTIAAHVPAPIKRRLKPIWWKYVKWPMPIWRLRGHGTFELAGHRFRFYGVAEPENSWWAWRAVDGRWEPEAIRFFAQSLRPGDVVLDVGAYNGAYTLLASRLVGESGHVFAFEPDPVARRGLARNVAANGARNVTIVPSAVTDRDGRAWLHSAELGGSMSSVSAEQGLFEVEAVTLTSFCAQRGVSPAVIKVDVEGGEASVLTDEARPLLERTRALVVEVHEPALERSGVDPKAFLQRFTDWGKRVVELETRPEFEGNYNVGVV